MIEWPFLIGLLAADILIGLGCGLVGLLIGKSLSQSDRDRLAFYRSLEEQRHLTENLSYTRLMQVQTDVDAGMILDREMRFDSDDDDEFCQECGGCLPTEEIVDCDDYGNPTISITSDS